MSSLEENIGNVGVYTRTPQVRDCLQYRVMRADVRTNKALKKIQPGLNKHGEPIKYAKAIALAAKGNVGKSFCSAALLTHLIEEYHIKPDKELEFQMYKLYTGQTSDAEYHNLLYEKDYFKTEIMSLRNAKLKGMDKRTFDSKLKDMKAKAPRVKIAWFGHDNREDLKSFLKGVDTAEYNALFNSLSTVKLSANNNSENRYRLHNRNIVGTKKFPYSAHVDIFLGADGIVNKWDNPKTLMELSEFYKIAQEAYDIIVVDIAGGTEDLSLQVLNQVCDSTVLVCDEGVSENNFIDIIKSGINRKIINTMDKGLASMLDNENIKNFSERNDQLPSYTVMQLAMLAAMGIDSNKLVNHDIEELCKIESLHDMFSYSNSNIYTSRNMNKMYVEEVVLTQVITQFDGLLQKIKNYELEKIAVPDVKPDNSNLLEVQKARRKRKSVEGKICLEYLSNAWKSLGVDEKFILAKSNSKINSIQDAAKRAQASHNEDLTAEIQLLTKKKNLLAGIERGIMSHFQYNCETEVRSFREAEKLYNSVEKFSVKPFLKQKFEDYRSLNLEVETLEEKINLANTGDNLRNAFKSDKYQASCAGFMLDLLSSCGEEYSQIKSWADYNPLNYYLMGNQFEVSYQFQSYVDNEILNFDDSKLEVYGVIEKYLKNLSKRSKFKDEDGTVRDNLLSEIFKVEDYNLTKGRDFWVNKLKDVFMKDPKFYNDVNVESQTEKNRLGAKKLFDIIGDYKKKIDDNKYIEVLNDLKNRFERVYLAESWKKTVESYNDDPIVSVIDFNIYNLGALPKSNQLLIAKDGKSKTGKAKRMEPGKLPEFLSDFMGRITDAGIKQTLKLTEIRDGAQEYSMSDVDVSKHEPEPEKSASWLNFDWLKKSIGGIKIFGTEASNPK